MNRDKPTWSVTEEDGDNLCILYKGKQFVMPRSDYTRKRTPEDHRRPGIASGAPEKMRAVYASDSSRLRRDTTDPAETKQIETKIFSKLIDELKGSPEQPPRFANNIRKSDLAPSYTLEDDSDSKETVVEKNLPMVSSSECANTQEPKLKIAFPSAESVNSRKPQETLSELKGTLVHLIDKTIDQLESQQDLAKGESAANDPINPGGDGSRAAHRMQNFQLLKTDSFAQTKREVRLKLFTEIETIVIRLKDMEKLN
ncbi:uncharacterized protein LOC129779887 [Toxorhynchites rutilus septentrionalis]|uniref:uncharacterized protein LOC129779887 n=1 Tax=Toxorhynchites rutilus septentrionalis TaxID=329112 RepID=UPI00247957A5|nr:uncharacterized protein LOC129779887 [Toxorhynchites rutilus septentrionalis]